MQNGDAMRVLVANLRPHAQEFVLRGLPAQVAVTSLDEESFAQAVGDPERYRAQAGQVVDTIAGALAWKLPPYAVLRVDFRKA